MKRLFALFLCALISAPACATRSGPRVQMAPTVSARSTSDRAVLAEFARQLPLGSRVKASVADEGTIRGTLLKVTDTSIVVQPRTRVAEPLAEVPFDRLLALEQDVPGSSAGRTAAISAAAAGGATLAVLMVLAAIFSD